jgi:predicted O-methyltransferase YrrM
MTLWRRKERKGSAELSWRSDVAEAELPALEANDVTVDMVAILAPSVVAEIGVARGATSLALARVMANRGDLHLFDYEDVVQRVGAEVNAHGFHNIHLHGNSRRLHDSYNWSLMRLLRDQPGFQFDYIFLDGAHTWAHDALAFLLLDRLLAPGGHIDFDDYDWSIAHSPSMNPKRFPKAIEWFSDEQIETCQVKLVVDLLVRSSGYEEVVENKVFRKAALNRR